MGGHEAYADKWIPLDDLKRVKSELKSAGNILNIIPEYVIAGDKEKNEV